MKHHVRDGSVSNSYENSDRERFAEDRSGGRHRRSDHNDRHRDRDFRDELDSRDERDGRNERRGRERDDDFEDDHLDNVHEIVRDVLHSNRGNRSMGPLDDLRQGLGSSWSEI